MFKPHYGTCVNCGEPDRLIVVKRGDCQFCNEKRKKEAKKAKGISPKTYSIPKFSNKRSEDEIKIREAKVLYKSQLVSLRCESCGSNDFCGCSHIISVNDCFGLSFIPNWLAWDVSNLVWECHNGKNCHATTEAKWESSYIRKSEQNTFLKKMNIYRIYHPRHYMRIFDHLQEVKPETIQTLHALELSE